MISGNSSAGRARPCQGRGREFESRFPLQYLKKAAKFAAFLFDFYLRLLSKTVMQWIANPSTAVRLRQQPPIDFIDTKQFSD